MTLHRLILDRRTIHDYRAGELPAGALERALEAAISAPNHRMTEPWRFVSVGPQTRPALLDIAADLKSAGGTLPFGDAARQKLRNKMITPSVLLVICQTRHADPNVAREDYAAVACAVQNAMLSLWSEGVGSKWSTGAVTTDERTYRTLEISPDTEQIVGFLWVGLASSEQPPKARRRRALSDVLRHLP
jgi:nitroreductase